MSPERLVTMLALAPTMPELRLSRMLRVAVLGASSLSSALSSALSLLSLALSLSSALNILDNLSSDMVGAGATIVTSLPGLNPITPCGKFPRNDIGYAGSSVLGLSVVVLGGIGFRLHRWFSPVGIRRLTVAIRLFIGVAVLLIAIAINFLHRSL